MQMNVLEHSQHKIYLFTISNWKQTQSIHLKMKLSSIWLQIMCTRRGENCKNIYTYINNHLINFNYTLILKLHTRAGEVNE